jgi:hypothetical protein
MRNVSRAIPVVALASAAFLSVDVLRLRADLRAYMPERPQPTPGTTSFIGADPEGIWVGTAEGARHTLVRHAPYASIGSVADTRNRIVIFDRNGAVLADVGAQSQDPVMVSYIRRRVQEFH